MERLGRGNFNSHAHVERDKCLNSCNYFCKNFNSHAHVERDAWNNRRGCNNNYFNSHAHVERDLHIRLYHFLKTISTHTLTWSVTLQTSLANVIFTFQLTRSRGAWQLAMFSVVDLFVISTHTLTWSVTLSIFGNSGMSAISTHTLTWSVTLADWLKYENVINFNSHAHVERDRWRC